MEMLDTIRTLALGATVGLPLAAALLALAVTLYTLARSR
jgi:hypothetical protein